MQGRGRTPGLGGFTLVELMIVVAIVGVLSATGLPAFARYVRSAKTAEAPHHLRQLYAGAQAYFHREAVGQGLTGGRLARCRITSSTTLDPVDPGPERQPVVGSAALTDLAFAAPDPVFFGYQVVVPPPVVMAIASAVPGCSIGASRDVYSFRAHGDLDGDDTRSTFELAVATNAAGELYRSAGLFVAGERE